MTSFSRTAIAAALFAAAGGVMATAPAHADKKDAAPQYKLSAAFRTPAAAAEAALKANDYATAQTQITAAQAAATNDDERYVAASLEVALVQQQGRATGKSDDQALAAPLDELLKNPNTPKTELGQFAFVRGEIAFNQNKYADALTYLQQAQAAGYQDPNLQLMIAKAQLQSGNSGAGVESIAKQIAAEKAAGQKPQENLYRVAIATLYRTNDRAATLDWVQRWLTDYPTAKNWNDAITVFGFQGPTAAQLNKNQKLDLYRLMDASGALADRNDYLGYAQMANDVGLPEEAKSVVDKGRAAGAIPSGDSTAAAIAKKANGDIALEGSLSSLTTKANASADGKLASQTADAYLGSGQYGQAATLYRTALQKGGVNAADVNTHLGVALARSGDLAGAGQAFALVTTAPDSDVAKLWQTWIATKTGGTATATAS